MRCGFKISHRLLIIVIVRIAPVGWEYIMDRRLPDEPSAGAVKVRLNFFQNCTSKLNELKEKPARGHEPKTFARGSYASH